MILVHYIPLEFYLLVALVLYEDNHCLAVDKPAGLLTQGDRTGEPTLLEWAREYLREKYTKPGNVFVGLVHRLDRPVSGVVLLARTSKAAARLSAQFRSGNVVKIYWAVVEGTVAGEAGEWADWLWKDAERNVVRVVPAGTSNAREAQLSYRVLDRDGSRTTLELRPVTGRSHQIRVQLAARGLPIVGDRKYGARSRLIARDGRPRVALHARELRFTHPTRAEVISVTAQVPAGWPARKLPG
ncbi:MAG TPA: RluA family pseudouridine synthase [Isosphaeraceae bacterium]|jgi:23S rRNA pseudouridine1911/1915/1917 synthase|nr:RluA family pseudouridine synthase [Isosphaeraceae bacterium]